MKEKDDKSGPAKKVAKYGSTKAKAKKGSQPKNAATRARYQEGTKGLKAKKANIKKPGRSGN